MAIAFVRAVDGGNNSSGSGHSFSLDCTSLDYVRVGIAGDVTGGANDVTAVTVDGQALALVAKLTATPRITEEWAGSITALSGSKTVAITAGTAHFIAAGAAGYSGVKTTGQPTNTTTTFSAADADASLTHSTTPTEADSWVFLTSGFFAGGVPPVAGTGSTRRTFDATFGLWGLLDSNSAQPASSYSMTWTHTGGAGADMGSIMSAAAPVPSSATFTPAQGAASLTGTSNSLGFGILMPDEL